MKHSQLSRDLVSLMMVIIWSLLWLLCRMCSGIFPKIHLNQLFVLSFNVWIFKYCFLDRNVCNLLVASKLLYIDHMRIATLCDKHILWYIILYKNILLINGNTRLWREWFQHWISYFYDSNAQIRWIISNSNRLYISKIFLFRYIPNDKHDKCSVSLDYNI